jgi:hypothetical protein
MKRITAYHLTDEDVHDIAQAAFVRLIALPQEKRNYPAAYHRTVINNACRTELKKILEHNNRVCSYNEPANESGGTYESVFADPHEHTEEKIVAKMTVERCLQVLDALAMQIVILAVGLHGQTPHTPHKIARMEVFGPRLVSLILNTRFDLSSFFRNNERLLYILSGKPRCRRCSAQFIEGRDVILAKVKFGGWCPSRIASTMSGARKAHRMITLT